VNALYFITFVLRIGPWVNLCIVTGCFSCHRILRVVKAVCFNNSLLLSLGSDYGWISALSQDSSLVIGLLSSHRIRRAVSVFCFNTLVSRIGLWVNLCIVTGFFSCHRTLLVIGFHAWWMPSIAKACSSRLDYGWIYVLWKDSSLVIGFFVCHRIQRVVNGLYFNALALRVGLWVNLCTVIGLFSCHRILHVMNAFHFNTLVHWVGLWVNLCIVTRSSLVIGFFSCHRILRVVTVVLRIGLWVNLCIVTGFFSRHWILLLS
jgi:hypothetical protein